MRAVRALALLGAGALAACGTPSASSQELPSDKVFVCKYVRKPGETGFELLQGGGNPISVSINSLTNGPIDIGSEFSDAQGLSIVIAFDTGQPEPDVGACPAPNGGTTTRARPPPPRPRPPPPRPRPPPPRPRPPPPRPRPPPPRPRWGPPRPRWGPHDHGGGHDDCARSDDDHCAGRHDDHGRWHNHRADWRAVRVQCRRAHLPGRGAADLHHLPGPPRVARPSRDAGVQHRRVGVADLHRRGHRASELPGFGGDRSGDADLHVGHRDGHRHGVLPDRGGLRAGDHHHRFGHHDDRSRCDDDDRAGCHDHSPGGRPPRPRRRSRRPSPSGRRPPSAWPRCRPSSSTSSTSSRSWSG